MFKKQGMFECNVTSAKQTNRLGTEVLPERNARYCII